MKQSQISKAYKAIEKLKTYSLPLEKAYQAFLLSKKIKECFDFACGEEIKCINKYKGEPQSNGSFKFPNHEDAVKCAARLDEIHNMDANIEFDPIVISVKDFDNDDKITISDLEDLEEFITITTE